jgi:chromatin remodeling complex protein RSC6
MPTKPNSAFMKPMNVSEDLSAVVGKGPMPRSEVTKKLWEYIKKNNLQDPKDKRTILNDEKLKKIFGTPSVHMMKMAGVISKHLS